MAISLGTLKCRVYFHYVRYEKSISNPLQSLWHHVKKDVFLSMIWYLCEAWNRSFDLLGNLSRNTSVLAIDLTSISFFANLPLAGLRIFPKVRFPLSVLAPRPVLSFLHDDSPGDAPAPSDPAHAPFCFGQIGKALKKHILPTYLQTCNLAKERSSWYARKWRIIFWMNRFS